MDDLDPDKIPRHIAIIPDGNGRWAEMRGLPRNEGHRRGTEVVREVVEAASDLGVKYVSVYAFSMENWGRPPEEIDAIMSLLRRYIRRERRELMSRGVQVKAIGRLDMLDPDLVGAIRELEEATSGNVEMRLTFALSYGGRTELTDVVRRIAREVESGHLDPDTIEEKDLAARLYAPDLPDPDLLIRTGGEHRISNFLLWQLAYTELWVTDALWPEFSQAHLLEAVRGYQQRERRFGRTGAQARGED
jgi:undecaprenyl diphosphate synthase